MQHKARNQGEHSLPELGKCVLLKFHISAKQPHSSEDEIFIIRKM